MPTVGPQTHLGHRVEDAALHRLEAVADIGQRARRDHRQRVVEISRLRGFVQRNVGRAAGTTALPEQRRARRRIASAALLP